MIEQPAYKVEAVDTTAAGDTFIGYFISGLVRGLDMEETLKLASRASSITVTRKGSSSSIPTIEEVAKIKDHDGLLFFIAMICKKSKILFKKRGDM